MNSCDKSSAFSLNPHLKAVSYFIFTHCIPSYVKQNLSSILHYATFAQLMEHLKNKWNSFTFFVRLMLTPVTVFGSKQFIITYFLLPLF